MLEVAGHLGTFLQPASFVPSRGNQEPCDYGDAGAVSARLRGSWLWGTPRVSCMAVPLTFARQEGHSEAEEWPAMSATPIPDL